GSVVKQQSFTSEKLQTPPPAPTFTPPDEPYYLYNGAQLGRTRNFGDNSPHWESVWSSLQGGIRDFVLHPYAPKDRPLVFANTGIWTTDNLDAQPSSIVWTNVLTTQQMHDDYIRLITPISEASDPPTRYHWTLNFCPEAFQGAIGIAVNPNSPGTFALTISEG